MKRDTAGLSLVYRVACLLRCLTSFRPPSPTLFNRSMPLPTAREFLAVVGFTSFIVCYCPAVLCSRRDRHRMTMMVEGEVENGQEGGGEFHVIVPGVRFCTAGRLLGAALPTAATTAAIMCG